MVRKVELYQVILLILKKKNHFVQLTLLVVFKDEMYDRTDRDCVENNIKDIVDLVKVGLFHSTFGACLALSTSLAKSNLPSQVVCI